MEYIAYLHKDRTSDFGVSFPDFPGCVTAGKTLEEARRLAPKVLALHIQGMIEDGEAVPGPSTLDVLASDRARKGAIAFLVSVDFAEKVERFNITARKSQMENIDRLASKNGMTRSAYMVASALGGRHRGVAVTHAAKQRANAKRTRKVVSRRSNPSSASRKRDLPGD
jgi:predicted RNase H-like HicB family nuclease